MIAFIDRERGECGVESICRVLPIAPSVYYEMKAREDDFLRIPPRLRYDAALCQAIGRIWNDNYEVYGARKVWHQLKRDGFNVGRCTVERLIRSMGLQGVVRGRTVKTTVPRPDDKRQLDLVQRESEASRPNQLWVADFTYVATWSVVMGWQVSSSMATEFTLDALEQALRAREAKGRLIHHSDRGSQYLSIRSSERLVDAGVDPSVGSTGDSYDNALAESIIGH
jgi:transposase InsO family protein